MRSVLAAALVVFATPAAAPAHAQKAEPVGEHSHHGRLVDAREHAQRWLETGAACDSAELDLAEFDLGTHAGMLANPSVARDAEGSRGITVRYRDAAFGIADHALAIGCFDVADRFYRHVIVHLDGPGAAGLRQRAQVGIDDVRAARARN